jgi:metal-responsive CopG/Arc/MetJ family transcriptional regulator
MKNATRIQLELPNDMVKHIEELMKEANVRTKKDLFNNALSLLEWAIKEKRDGREIASIDEKEKAYKEIVMPILSNVAKNSKKKTGK